MAIGERIRFFRNKRGMTMKYLGQAVGFPEKSADVRLAQYETGTRSPKADLTAALAKELDVAPEALAVPDIDTNIGLMHTLFTLEDVYGLSIAELNGEVCLHVSNDKGTISVDLHRMLTAWQEQSAKLKAGEITQGQYDQWRYYYPKYDVTEQWVKVPSQELSNALTEAFQDNFKNT